jgi:hypothetical protein
MAEAAQLQRRRAGERGPEAVQRVELLRLRFEENLPIRTIAVRWGIPAAGLHHAYAKAHHEFRAALLEVVAFHHPGFCPMVRPGRGIPRGTRRRPAAAPASAPSGPRAAWRGARTCWIKWTAR